MVGGNHDAGSGLYPGPGQRRWGLAENENYKAIVPEGIQKFIDETEQKIINGDIAVGTAFDMSTEDVAALRDGMKP